MPYSYFVVEVTNKEIKSIHSEYISTFFMTDSAEYLSIKKMSQFFFCKIKEEDKANFLTSNVKVHVSIFFFLVLYTNADNTLVLTLI